MAKRRKAHEVEGRTLQTDTGNLITAARKYLTATEIAALVGVHRTGIYRTYS